VSSEAHPVDIVGRPVTGEDRFPASEGFSVPGTTADRVVFTRDTFRLLNDMSRHSHRETCEKKSFFELQKGKAPGQIRRRFDLSPKSLVPQAATQAAISTLAEPQTSPRHPRPRQPLNLSDSTGDRSRSSCPEEIQSQCRSQDHKRRSRRRGSSSPALRQRRRQYQRHTARFPRQLLYKRLNRTTDTTLTKTTTTHPAAGCGASRQGKSTSGKDGSCRCTGV
jgi:hypothetical protein